MSHHGTVDALGAALGCVLVATEGVTTTGAVAVAGVVVALVTVGALPPVVGPASFLSFASPRPVSDPMANAIITSSATPPAPR